MFFPGNWVFHWPVDDHVGTGLCIDSDRDHHGVYDKGGMWSVVGTEVLQLVIMTVSCVVIGVIAWNQVRPEQIDQVVPDGWRNLFFQWKLDLDWSGTLNSVNDKIASDGFGWFGFW